MLSADPYAPAPALLQLAEHWPTYLGASERTGKTRGPSGELLDQAPLEVAVLRCARCHDEVFPPDQSGRLGHLLTSHGYRMDGRQFDNHNEQIGDAS